MRFQVIGADKETGEDVDVVLVASTRAVAEHDAAKRGIMVSAIKEVQEVKEIIDLEPETPPAPTDGAAKDGAPKDGARHGRITLSADSPSESGFSGEAGQRKAHDIGSLEYHVIMNQALYLLETAVNKYLKEGWEPAGGIAVGVSSNALQYFQAVTRRHAPGEIKHA